MRAIADLELAKTAERVRERGIALEVSTALMQRIVAEGYNEAMGARELRRAVVHLVDDPLSDALLRGEVSSPGRGPATAARPPARPPSIACARPPGPHPATHPTPALTSVLLLPRLPPVQIRAGDTAVLDCDAATGRTLVLNRAHLASNNIVTADLEIVYSSVAA